MITQQQSANSGAQVTAAPTTSTSTSPFSQAYPYTLCDDFEADLFELQLDASPSLALRSSIAGHLSGVISYPRVMKASRFRLLHWMLELENRHEQIKHEPEQWVKC